MAMQQLLRFGYPSKGSDGMVSGLVAVGFSFDSVFKSFQSVWRFLFLKVVFYHPSRPIRFAFWSRITISPIPSFDRESSMKAMYSILFHNIPYVFWTRNNQEDDKEIYIERKIHHEGWGGAKSAKERCLVCSLPWKLTCHTQIWIRHRRVLHWFWWNCLSHRCVLPQEAPRQKLTLLPKVSEG